VLFGLAIAGLVALRLGIGFLLGRNDSDDHDAVVTGAAYGEQEIDGTDIEDLAVGECFVQSPVGDQYAGGTLAEVIIVPCAEPHDGQYVLDVSLTDEVSGDDMARLFD
jgi:hypothetical protein